VPRRRLFAVLAVLLIGGGGIAGYRWWQNSLHYVSTDNAQIGGYLVQVGTLSAGRVTSVLYDIGDRVSTDDVVARVVVPTTLSQTAPGTPRQQYLGRNDTLVDVRSTATGVVAARGANPGDTVAAGQSILTVVDPNQMWVTANVLETDVARVRPGQPVTVHVDNLGLDLTGKVAGIAQASAQSFSPLPQMNVSGNYTKVAQLQPVKIWLDDPDPRLALGTSAEVRIRVVD
jgi:multidrug resistance efflux pump